MPLSPVVDSTVGLPDPAETARKNAETFSQIATAQQNRQLTAVKVGEHQLAADAAAQKQARMAAMQEDTAAWAQQGRSLSGIMDIMAKYPEAHEGLKPIMEQASAEDKKAIAAQGLPIINAVLNDNIPLALRTGEQTAVALENGGKPGDAKALRASLELLKTDRATALANLRIPVEAAMGPEAFNNATADALAKRRKLEAETKTAEIEAGKRPAKLDAETLASRGSAASGFGSAAKSREEIRVSGLETPLKLENLKKTGQLTDAQTENQIGENIARALELGPKLEKLKKEGQRADAEVKKMGVEANRLPEYLGKASLESVEKADTARVELAKIRDVQAKYAAMPPGLTSSGVLARLAESGKEFFGKEDPLTALRKMAQGIIQEDLMNQALKLKPVSDNDMKILREPLFASTASAPRVAEYMNALGNAREQQMRTHLTKSAWINANKDPGNAVEDLQILGEKVPKGTSLAEFMAGDHTKLVRLAELRAAKAKAGK